MNLSKTERKNKISLYLPWQMGQGRCYEAQTNFSMNRKPKKLAWAGTRTGVSFSFVHLCVYNREQNVTLRLTFQVTPLLFQQVTFPAQTVDNAGAVIHCEHGDKKKKKTLQIRQRLFLFVRRINSRIIQLECVFLSHCWSQNGLTFATAFIWMHNWYTGSTCLCSPRLF